MPEYRTFKAPTQKEAREMMLKSMGSKAYIVMERKIVRRTMLGLRKAEEWEIQAGFTVAPPAPAPRASIPSPATARKVSETLALIDQMRSMPKEAPAAEPRDEKITQLLAALAKQKSARVATSAPTAKAPMRPSMPERPDLSGMEVDAVSSPATAPRRSYDLTTGLPKEPRLPVADVSVREPSPDSAEGFLLAREFEPALAQAAARRSGLGRVDGAEDRKALAAAVAAEMVYSDPVMVYETNPNVVFFVGTTGVGKTTTVPKVAFLHGLSKGRSVVLATFDLWRIMAVEMLRKFAMILEVPFEVIHEPATLITLIRNRMDAHLIMVDTGGLPPGEEKKLADIFELVGEVQIPKEVHLCVSAGMRTRDMENTLRSFGPAKFDRILITKSDETTSLGPVLSVVRRSGVPLSYVTTGQKIPDKIFKADRASLAAHLVEEWKR